MKSGVRFGGIFVAECYEKNTGRLKWKRIAHNKVVNQGIQYLLDVGFTGDTYISPWYTGLMASTVITSTYTMGNISEATEISNANRPIYVETRSANTLTNSAAKSTFTINKDGTTVEGAFLCSSNTIGSTAGILMSGAPFTGGAKEGDSGDKVIVTYTFVGSDDTST
jgi:hypothetical protein